MKIEEIENNPVCKKNTKECHSKNRRVEIK